MSALRFVVSFGGGAASFVLGKRLVEQHGHENVDVLMAALHDDERDGERLDLEFERVTGKAVTRITVDQMDGGHVSSVRELQAGEPAPYSVWDVFFMTGRMGSTMADPCSRILKREVLRTYMLDNYTPEETVMCVGITADEIDRMMAITRNWQRDGFKIEAPLADAELTREQIERELEAAIGYLPTLYREGRLHKNCGGACVKAGLAEWARFLWYRPDEFARWEQMEGLHQICFDHTSTILRKQTYTYERVEVDNSVSSTVPMFPDLRAPETVTKRKKVYDTRPYSLREFREDMQEKWSRMLPGQDPFADLESQPSCTFCGSM